MVRAAAIGFALVAIASCGGRIRATDGAAGGQGGGGQTAGSVTTGTAGIGDTCGSNGCPGAPLARPQAWVCCDPNCSLCFQAYVTDPIY